MRDGTGTSLPAPRTNDGRSPHGGALLRGQHLIHQRDEGLLIARVDAEASIARHDGVLLGR